MKSVLVLLLGLGLVVPLGAVQAQILFTATLTGSQEAPPVTTTANGTAWVVMSADMKSLTYRMTYASLSAARTGAHFHAGGTGNGSVVLPLSFAGNTVSGTWSSLPDSIVRHFLKGDMYVNVHSSNFSGGEIRGYFQVARGVGYTIGLDGSQASPPTSSTATGTGWAVLDSAGARLTYNATIAGLSAALTGAHFHVAPSGSVADPISFVDSTTQGAWLGVPDADLTALTSGNIYMNVHSSNFPGGEISGFVLMTPTVTTGVETVSRDIPAAFRLDQNYPNPFNPSTTIKFQLDRITPVSLKVYNLLGQEVASLFEGTMASGTHEVTFDARSLASGLYFYRLATSGGQSDTRKMMLLK
jgi:hypothetical protein